MAAKPNNSMSAKTLGCLLGAIAVLGFLYWMISGTSALFQRIMPGTGITPSTSMEPYEINLRTIKPVDWEPGMPKNVYEWKLKVPLAYVISETGRNGVTEGDEWFRNENYFVHIRGIVPDDIGSIKPVLDRRVDSKDISIFIKLHNSSIVNWIANNELCFKSDDSEIVARDHNIELTRFSPPCHPDPRIKTCDITTTYKGWSVLIAADKRIYEKTNVVCGLVRDFFDNHTIEIDDLRATKQQLR